MSCISTRTHTCGALHMRPVVYKTNIFCAHMSTWQTRVRPMFQYDASRSEMRVMKRKTAYVSGCHDTWATITTNNTTDRHVSGLFVILSDTSLPYTLRVMPVSHVTSTIFVTRTPHTRYKSFGQICICHVPTCIWFFVCNNWFCRHVTGCHDMYRSCHDMYRVFCMS